MTIEHLKELLKSGKFHHATYRYEYARGLHIYDQNNNGFRGFNYAGAFSESLTPAHVLDYAYHLVRNTGVSLGAYGQG